MEIKISEKAKRQLRNIYNYFLENSTKYAEELINGFYKKLENLKRFPKICSIVPKFEHYEIRKLLFKSYRILYQFNEDNDEIKIITILHSKQRLKL